MICFRNLRYLLIWIFSREVKRIWDGYFHIFLKSTEAVLLNTEPCNWRDSVHLFHLRVWMIHTLPLQILYQSFLLWDCLVPVVPWVIVITAKCITGCDSNSGSVNWTPSWLAKWKMLKYNLSRSFACSRPQMLHLIMYCLSCYLRNLMKYITE